MNKRIKKMWLKALRSGEYRQGRYSLVKFRSAAHRKDSPDRFCCLGVLCDLYLRETGGHWTNLSGELLLANQATFLPGIVQDWSGVGDRWATLPQGGGKFRNLAAMNDEGASFEEIADTIEEQF